MLIFKKICKFLKPEKVPTVLDHITDVGASHFEGVDSMYRIRQQYQDSNVKNPCVISAGHSPLHVAFTGTTCLSIKARENSKWILKKFFDITQKKKLPIALNSAPRNSEHIKEDGKEDSIFWIKTEDPYADYIVYGMQVVEWVSVFHKIKSIYRIKSVPDIIEDTSHGSQFRSAEHLPLVHVLLAMNELEEHSEIEEISLDKIKDRYPHPTDGVVAPSDEYHNCRVVVDKTTMDNILKNKSCIIPDLYKNRITACTSLTKVTPGELSIWPSSNYFPNENLAVLNIGTRWAFNTTKVTDKLVKDISKLLSEKVGDTLHIEI